MLSIEIVNPPAPLNPVKITFPDKTEYIFVPSGTPISIPEWLLDAPVVGDILFPNGDVILWYPGTGQKKSEFEK